MKTHSLRHAVIALLAVVPLLAGGAEAAEPGATPAWPSPPNPLRDGLSPPLGDRAITDNGLAQRVMLYEEEPGDPQGRRAAGSVVWSTEIAPSGTGIMPQLVLRADINIPDRKMEISWKLRRASDLNGSSSHTAELRFKLPPDFASGGIFNVPGIWMKPAIPAQGAALHGLSVKVKPGYFLIGLSNAPADRERNIQLLKDRSVIDIPIVYNNNWRAILQFEKGTPGEQAFQQAFAAWEE